MDRGRKSSHFFHWGEMPLYDISLILLWPLYRFSSLVISVPVRVSIDDVVDAVHGNIYLLLSLCESRQVQ